MFDLKNAASIRLSIDSYRTVPSYQRGRARVTRLAESLQTDSASKEVRSTTAHL